MVVDLSVVVNVLSNRKSVKPKVFGEFSEYVFVELKNLSRRSAMIDTVCDLYSEGLNLKELIQIERGIGIQLNFDNGTEFPSDFASDFLRKNENKRMFCPYLVDKILEKVYYKDKIVVVTSNEKIEMNLKGTLANINMSDSSHSEADARIILHVFSCVHSGLKDIYVRTNGTDVVVILVAYMPDFLEIDSNVRVSVVSGVGFNTSCISVNAIAAYIGLKKCKELLFLHSLSGCDYTSSFFHIGKVRNFRMHV